MKSCIKFVVQLHPENMFKKLLTIVFVGISLFAPTDDVKINQTNKKVRISSADQTSPNTYTLIESDLIQ